MESVGQYREWQARGIAFNLMSKCPSRSDVSVAIPLEVAGREPLEKILFKELASPPRFSPAVLGRRYCRFPVYFVRSEAVNNLLRHNPRRCSQYWLTVLSVSKPYLLLRRKLMLLASEK